MIDLSTAFNMINHCILLSILSDMGITGSRCGPPYLHPPLPNVLMYYFKCISFLHNLNSLYVSVCVFRTQLCPTLLISIKPLFKCPGSQKDWHILTLSTFSKSNQTFWLVFQSAHGLYTGKTTVNLSLSLQGILCAKLQEVLDQCDKFHAKAT